MEGQGFRLTGQYELIMSVVMYDVSPFWGVLLCDGKPLRLTKEGSMKSRHMCQTNWPLSEE
jgi:hypothetical protein